MHHQPRSTALFNFQQYAYSCNSSIPFYSDSTQPVFPLIIRLESKNPVNGSLSVLVNGKLEPQSDSESHVAEYETGTFTIENEQESMIFELNYPPAKGNIHVFFDVVPIAPYSKSTHQPYTSLLTPPTFLRPLFNFGNLLKAPHGTLH
uniref:Uncharacterized protein n=1 Tax=Caenorhabditis japonica TaxID=281687 RepID=A0A8R1DDE3_CAEJA